MRDVVGRRRQVFAYLRGDLLGAAVGDDFVDDPVARVGELAARETSVRPWWLGTTSEQDSPKPFGAQRPSTGGALLNSRGR
jgi:hypothetical protein